jgi:hypothetical protein
MTTAIAQPATYVPVRCGNRKAHGPDVYHNGRTEVRDCFAGRLATEPDHDNGAAAAELAYERHLEDRGYDDARAQEEHEARHGVVGFIQAWHDASPETCPCDRH